MRYRKIHYDPFANSCDEESWSDQGICGIYIYDGNSSNDKDDISCKKCIKKFKEADKEVKQAREHELNDMQAFVDFMNNENKK